MGGMAPLLFLLIVIFSGPSIAEAKLGKPTSNSSVVAEKNLPTVKIVREKERRLQTVQDHGGTPNDRYFPLGVCEGDCDDDSQCASGLKCFQRDGGEAVPGCSGGEKVMAGTDFCVPTGSDNSLGQTNGNTDAEESGVIMPAMQASSARTSRAGGGSLGLCEGDCDDDSDCMGDLICHQRSKGDPSPSQCPNVNPRTQQDYCVEPGGSSPASSPSGNGGSGLGHCEGDCDKDSDCKSGLICYQRGLHDPLPKGCDGNTNTNTDYCVDPNSFSETDERQRDGNDAGDTKSFRLKMYWEEGYTWQEETFERKWCAMRDFDGYPGRGKCWYGLEVRGCNPDHVYTAQCNDDERQQWVFEYVNDSEVLIKAKGENRCLYRQGTDIYLQACNPGNSDQRFFAIRGGFSDYRFEISQKSATRYCLNQAHHPKPGEYLAMYPCAASRYDKTSYWNRD